MTIDEVSMWKDDDVGDFCYCVTQGRDKARLNRNAEERTTKEWATTVTVSTNKSFMAKMVATGLDTDAQMARLLEIPIPPHKLFDKSSEGGRKIFQHITSNYGVVGEVYVKALLRIGREGLQERIAETTAKFRELYNFEFRGAERYWEMCLILTHVGMQIAQEASLIAFDYTLGVKWAVGQIDTMRGSIKDNQTDAFKLVHEYLNEVAADTLVIMHTADGPSTMDYNRVPRGEVKARFDVYRKTALDKFDHGVVMLIKKQFRQWVSARGYDYSVLAAEIRGQGVDATPSTGRIWVARNTSLKIGQLSVLGINLNHPEMLGYLEDIELAAQEMSKGQLSLV